MMSDLGERLRQMRQNRGLTVRAFAERIGKTSGYISRIEGRGELPSPQFLCEIADVYQIDPKELLDLWKRVQIKRKSCEIEAKCASSLALHRKEKK